MSSFTPFPNVGDEPLGTDCPRQLSHALVLRSVYEKEEEVTKVKDPLCGRRRTDQARPEPCEGEK